MLEYIFSQEGTLLWASLLSAQVLQFVLLATVRHLVLLLCLDSIVHDTIKQILTSLSILPFSMHCPVHP